MSIETLTGSPFLSYSSLDSYLTCGEKYRLTKVVGVAQDPAWYLFGGSAVHTATEWIDRGEETSVVEAFRKAWAQQTENIEDRAKVRAGGRVSKAWPAKENDQWWLHNGPELVQNWVTWRQVREHQGWQIRDVEYAFEMTLGTVPVRGFIDRVMVDPNGQVHVIDLKTGSHSPTSALQLGVYALAYEAGTGERPAIGAYFMNRKAELTPPESMNRFTTELVGSWFDMARTAIEAEVFIPKPSGLCRSCTVADKCSLFGDPILSPNK